MLTNIELVVDIGAVLQKGVHHCRVTILTGCGECCAAILEITNPSVLNDQKSQLRYINTAI